MSGCEPLAVAVAVKSAGLPDVAERVFVFGVIVMAVMPLRKTVAVAVACNPSASAVIVADPRLIPVRIPVFGSTGAMVGVSLDQDMPLFT
jgi:hypothetical protein